MHFGVDIDTIKIVQALWKVSPLATRLTLVKLYLTENGAEYGFTSLSWREWWKSTYNVKYGSITQKNLIKYSTNTDQIFIKIRSNTHQILIKIGSKTHQIRIKYSTKSEKYSTSTDQILNIIGSHTHQIRIKSGSKWIKIG